jgi:hypothetical protein
VKANEPLLREVHVAGFRSARDLRLRPNPVCALVGEARAGKSNVLAAIRAVLDGAATDALAPTDVARGEDAIRIRARLGHGGVVQIDGTPPRLVATGQEDAPAVMMLSAQARADALVAGPAPRHPAAAAVARVFAEHLIAQREARDGVSDTGAALAMVDAVRASTGAGVSGTVLLIEEPELYLSPQAQRYLYRMLRRFASRGNQVIYSTHSPAFLNVARLDELVFVQRPADGSRAVRPKPVTADEDFRVLSEFDAERAELFLARAALLVEGMTEKLAMPFVFAAVGIDPDGEGISIVECGGKANIPLFARVCAAAGVPFVALHDRDASRSERRLNALIADIAGHDHAIALEPDFEGAARLRGHTHKPDQAWTDFSRRPADRIPEPLTRAARLTARLAREA